MKTTLTFVHISDTHIGPTPDFERYGVQPLSCAERLIDLINALPQQPDFVVHSGDVSDDRSAESYELIAPLLARLKVPIYYVSGNHDDPALLRKYMGAPDHASGDPAAPLDYTFEVKGERFLVVDAKGLPEPQGHLTGDQLDMIRAECAPEGPPLTVLIHYPPFDMDSPWLNANMLIDNGEALHEVLLPARDRIRGVFYGHLHKSCQIARDGITYTSVASAFSQFHWWPWQEGPPPVDGDFPPSFNYVQYFPDYALVHQHTFPRP